MLSSRPRELRLPIPEVLVEAEGLVAKCGELRGSSYQCELVLDAVAQAAVKQGTQHCVVVAREIPPFLELDDIAADLVRVFHLDVL